MGLLEILIIVACSVIVLSVVICRIIAKKQGKCTCDCGGDCSCCHKYNKEKK